MKEPSNIGVRRSHLAPTGRGDDLEDETTSPRDGLSRRGRPLAVIIVAALLILVGGWWAGSKIRSPADVAASTEAPSPSVITAQVEMRRLSDAVVIRGTVEAAGHDAVFGYQPAEVSVPVLTQSSPAVGSEIVLGQLVTEIAGRPLFVLEGRIPMYRSITPGAEGPDVEQLQEGLTDLGLGIGGDPSGVFGTGTQSSVRAWYASRGAEPIGPSAAETRMIHDLQVEVDQTAAALARARAAGKQAESARLQTLLTTQQTSLAEAQASIGITISEGEIAFVAELPARVQSTSGGLGRKITLNKPLLELALGSFRVETLLLAVDRDVVDIGDRVTIKSEVLGRSKEGHVVKIAGDLSSPGDAPQGYRALIEADEPLNRMWLGQDVRLTITAASTQGKVLVVPVAAVTTSADGTTRIFKVNSDGSESAVSVEIGFSANGLVAITAVQGDLAVGDSVAIGE